MINSVHKYMYAPMTRKEKEAEDRKRSLQQLRVNDPNNESNQVSPTSVSNVYNDKERSPLLPKDISIQIGNNLILKLKKVFTIQSTCRLRYARYYKED